MPNNSTIKALIGLIIISTGVGCTALHKPQLTDKLGSNVAFGKPFTSSHPNSAGWLGLTDGSWAEDSTHTYATSTARRGGKFVTIDLEKTHAVTHVRMGVPAFGSTKLVVLSLGEDGSKFTPVDEYEFAQGRTQEHTFVFPSRPARYVRITYIDAYEKKIRYNIWCGFTTEVEVYAAGK